MIGSNLGNEPEFPAGIFKWFHAAAIIPDLPEEPPHEAK
jgi:hypothetical protein